MQVVILGLLMGMVHVFTGPDHIAAIAPLSGQKPKQGFKSGFFWGLGHSISIAVIALLLSLIFTNNAIASLAHYAEKLVGLVLIIVGLFGARHFVNKTHDNIHQEVSVLIALGIGLLHGLAGGSHIIALLPTAIINDNILKLLYVFAFSAGSILSMAGFSLGLSLFLQQKSKNIYRNLKILLSSISLCVGIYWLWAT